MMRRCALLLLLTVCSLQAHVQFDERDACYRVLKYFLNQYKRPITVLEIGADRNCYSCRIIQDYQAVCVMIATPSTADSEKSQQLLDVCKKNKKVGGVVFLDKSFTPQDLCHLGDCEHFDVILASDIVHQFGSEWKEALDALFTLGDYVVFEMPVSEENEDSLLSSMKSYILAKGAYLFDPLPDRAQNTAVAFYILETGKKTLRRKTWLLPRMEEGKYRLDSSFTHKTLHKPVYWPPQAEQTTQWIPGINLLTFKMCNGIYPTKEMIKENLHQLKKTTQTDWMINNMIVQGDTLAWIDVADLSRADGGITKPTCFSEAGLRAHETLIDLDDPKKIEHYFWHTLIYTPVRKKARIKFFAKLLDKSSLIFDIHGCDDELIDIYLGLGSKVICFNMSSNLDRLVLHKFQHDEVIKAHKNLTDATSPQVTLDEMLNLYGKSSYGMPRFCNIHLSPERVIDVLQGLSHPIAHIAFKFDLRLLSQLESCLAYLAGIGYRHFNFSVRDIPLLMLSRNVHTGVTKDWVAAHALVQEIKKCAAVDHQGEALSGIIYAHYRV